VLNRVKQNWLSKWFLVTAQVVLITGFVVSTGCQNNQEGPEQQPPPEHVQNDRNPMAAPNNQPIHVSHLGAPNPLTVTPGEVGEFFSSQTGPTQSMNTFMYGEWCGRQLPLENIVAISREIPPQTLAEFFDGAAHGYTPETHEAKVLVPIIESTIPKMYQHFFHDGVIRSFTEEHKADPAQVIPFVTKYAEQIENYTPHNGVRVGLQRALGHSPTRAMEMAALYPEDYHAALFEELGWKIGDGLDLTRIQSEGLVAHVPETSHCVLAQGIARGYVLGMEMKKQISWPQIETELTTHVAPICERGTWRGVGWAVELLSARNADEFSRMLSWMTDAQRAWAEEAMAAAGLPSWVFDPVIPPENEPAQTGN